MEKLSSKGEWLLSHHIQLQGGLQFYAPHTFKKLPRIWNGDPTLRQTYCEFDGNQIISKIVGKLLSPSQPLVVCFFSRGEVQHQIDQMFHCH
jgi:hypothetical protein